MPGGWQDSTRRDRLPDDWPRIRLRVLVRDGYRCRLRLGDICLRTATEVDHIRRGDDHRDVNLQAVCAPCHARKTSSEGNAARLRLHRPPERHPGLL